MNSIPADDNPSTGIKFSGVSNLHAFILTIRGQLENWVEKLSLFPHHEYPFSTSTFPTVTISNVYKMKERLIVD